jgi:hypothetical protein
LRPPLLVQGRQCRNHASRRFAPLWHGYGLRLSALPISPYGETAPLRGLPFTLSLVRGANPLHFINLKELKMSQQNNFDFSAFNDLTERKPAGLQIFLAQQLLSNALWSMEKYDNPRSQLVQDALNQIKSLRALMKQDAEVRARGE